jgi:hypothetical protein
MYGGRRLSKKVSRRKRWLSSGGSSEPITDNVISTVTKAPEVLIVLSSNQITLPQSRNRGRIHDHTPVVGCLAARRTLEVYDCKNSTVRCRRAEGREAVYPGLFVLHSHNSQAGDDPYTLSKTIPLGTRPLIWPLKWLGFQRSRNFPRRGRRC